MDVTWRSPDGSVPGYLRARPAARGGMAVPGPRVAMASRPTSPTSAHGYHQELMAAVPSKELRQTPQDGA